tara:strand:+ start:2243 stop:2527 length:285 start_codon:yes stop_codon:yes gene_type:complete
MNIRNNYEALVAALTLGLLAQGEDEEEKVDHCCDMAAGFAVLLSEDEVERAKVDAREIAKKVMRGSMAAPLTAKQGKALKQWQAHHGSSDPSLN